MPTLVLGLAALLLLVLLGKLFVAAGQLVAAGLLSLVQRPAELLDLRAEPADLTPELITFSPESLALAPGGFQVSRLLPCGCELLVAAGQFVPVVLLGPFEGLAELAGLRTNSLGVIPELIAFGSESFGVAAEVLRGSCLLP